MLSYRHAFHAGNHADVIKHLTLVLCCEHLCKKDKGFSYIDTHAGAGMYDLKSESASKNNEHIDGVSSLTTLPKPPKVLNSYLQLIEQAKKHKANAYPGSPWFAAQLLRSQDQAALFEMHPKDFSLLASLFSGNRRIKVKQSDGYQSLKSLFPPPSRRAITLIDPPYEQEKEYQDVINTLKDGISRFNSGSYIVWYPLINRSNSAKDKAAEKMVRHIKTLFKQEQLHVQFILDKNQQGMYGSGLAIINPPWGLKEQLQEALTFLCSIGDTKKRQFSLEAIDVNQSNNKTQRKD
jgi:23S rRNA (adenine2030-N6)-methyltransferase